MMFTVLLTICTDAVISRVEYYVWLAQVWLFERKFFFLLSNCYSICVALAVPLFVVDTQIYLYTCLRYDEAVIIPNVWSSSGPTKDLLFDLLWAFCGPVLSETGITFLYTVFAPSYGTTPMQRVMCVVYTQNPFHGCWLYATLILGAIKVVLITQEFHWSTVPCIGSWL